MNYLKLFQILVIFPAIIGAGCTKNTSKVGEPTLTKTSKMIYGEDNRNDYFDYQLKDYLKYSKSVGMLIRSKQLVYDESEPDTTLIIGTTLNKLKPACSDKPNRYKDQISAGYCSGFLISPTTFVTAGHCFLGERSYIESADQLNIEEVKVDEKIVFDFAAQDSSDKINNDIYFVPTKNVYSIKEIKKIKIISAESDYAIIELDRPVEGAIPFEIEQKDETKENDPLLLIGHPMGLPMKFTDNGVIRKINSTHYYANLDAFSGNSGSVVLNLRTNKVIGILQQGEEDYLSKVVEPKIELSSVAETIKETINSIFVNKRKDENNVNPINTNDVKKPTSTTCYYENSNASFPENTQISEKILKIDIAFNEESPYQQYFNEMVRVNSKIDLYIGDLAKNAAVVVATPDPSGTPIVNVPKTIDETVITQSLSDLKNLLDKNPTLINEQDVEGDNGLTFALKNKNLYLAKFLLDRGININQEHPRYKSALFISVLMNDTSALSLLLEYKPNLNVTLDGIRTPVDVALDMGYTDLVEILENYEVTNE